VTTWTRCYESTSSVYVVPSHCGVTQALIPGGLPASPYNPQQCLALTPGACIGPYEIVSAIGAGGMGEVYRATDAKLGRDVALPSRRTSWIP
jgi:serine/threonine protein kinase